MPKLWGNLLDHHLIRIPGQCRDLEVKRRSKVELYSFTLETKSGSEASRLPVKALAAFFRPLLIGKSVDLTQIRFTSQLFLSKCLADSFLLTEEASSK